MVAKCLTSYNGQLYPAGVEIPTGETTEKQTSVETKAETVVEKPKRKKKSE